jgi:hydrogenase nickel incorporation protein HypA/HybF
VHELTLAANLLELTEEHARANGFVQVLRVHLALGALAPVDEAALAFGFEVARRGTVAESADLEIERVAGRGCCLRCSARAMCASSDGTFEVDARGAPCPTCGSFDWKLVAGDELRLVGLEGT